MESEEEKYGVCGRHPEKLSEINTQPVEK